MHLYDAAKGRFYTWMINIARNTAIDYLKSRSFQNDLKNQQLSDFVYQSAAVSAAQPSDFIGFSKILESLDSEEQELIQLAYFQGYTHSEIAERLNMPLGTVKTKIRTALLKLREVLKDDY